jgi:hypothetical protein
MIFDLVTSPVWLDVQTADVQSSFKLQIFQRESYGQAQGGLLRMGSILLSLKLGDFT